MLASETPEFSEVTDPPSSMKLEKLTQATEDTISKREKRHEFGQVAKLALTLKGL